MSLMLNDVIAELRTLVRYNSHKHTPYITLHKAHIYAILDKLDSVSHSIEEGSKSCDKCPLYRREQDLRVARATIDRLIANAERRDSVITRDEALNLQGFIEGAVKAPYEDSRITLDVKGPYFLH